MERKIKAKLREIMSTEDLDSITSKQVQLENITCKQLQLENIACKPPQ